MTRDRFKQTEPLQDRLARFADDIRAQAENLPPGPERDEMMKRVCAADTAMDLISSPRSQPK
jgi:hypothetical protein